MTNIDDEVAKLRERQGPGARYDAITAPSTALKCARHGTAYFARKLNELSDSELGRETLIPGWSRCRLIAHVGYQARALSRIIEAAHAGKVREFSSAEERLLELDHGETLPPRALRHLFHHAAVHLNVEWRELTDVQWDVHVMDFSQQPLVVRDTPFVRAAAVWIHAVDLNNGGSFRDFPIEFIDAIIAGNGKQLTAEALSFDDYGELPVRSERAAELANLLARSGVIGNKNDAARSRIPGPIWETSDVISSAVRKS